MEIKLLHQPDSAIAQILLNAGEEIVAEAGSMIAMSGYINTSTTLRRGKGGGVFGGLKRMLAGESLFLSVFRSPTQGGEIFLAPHLMGDLLVYEMKGQELVVQATSYLASASSVDIDLGFQGFKSFFSGEAIFWLSISGHGPVILTSFGGIYDIDVAGEYIVDTGHIVAFEKSLDFEITKAGSSLIGAFLGGEGLVCRFKGKGKVYCQTHNPGAFGSRIGSQLPAR
ncbi:TIGR00266 family protein [Desertifilum sp. FACHB-1129]|uniref:TIGR00266 family protein n=2 Tax=Cyanophyceae TaxID=3028117 RepID=A0A1E5QLY8_9CYAN|nr:MULTISPECIES: TIGR00266 family protein [Cyanophyceae]MDA0213394.1 TIGR00266 family protein [Cyanobacteria bacterium FC1]MDK3156580.1 TIGR00266 family protein [Kamptonema cortianum]MBD2313668.1 TIGR00266 family protein [Desertifilum sp. FACHB-1129]MBD2324818.1 TIGR00266 family protein [Desertifilum sp. FACHB-866]MBD2334934.1 TIGR00266 family protein [Desertifilum sp. FACHB-868]